MATQSPRQFTEDLLPFVRGKPMNDALHAVLLNLANDSLNSFANWRWLTESAESIDISDVQVYEWQPASPITRVLMIYGISSEQRVSTLMPVSAVPASDAAASDFPTLFEYVPTADMARVRLWPKPPTGLLGKIVPIVKKKHTRVTDSNLESLNVLDHPDEYNHIFHLFLLDFLYLYNQVGALSTVAINSQGQETVSGTLARAHQAARAIMSNEAIFLDTMGRPQP